ncbi:MAG: TonB family protein [Xenococcaceae cyanobacterium]
MTTAKRKEKHNIQISFDPFLLFILTSVLVHGLGIAIFVLADRSRQDTSQETEVTPIDFIVVPPEEATEEPPPDTERRAINNSIAKGKVNPDLPSATNKIGNEPATTTPKSSPTIPPNIAKIPANSVARQTPPPQLESTPPPESKPVKPLPSIPPVQKTPTREQPPATSATTPPLVKPAKPSPSVSKAPSTPTSSSEEVKPAPSVTKKPKPIEKTPLTSEFKPRSIPLPKLEPLPEKEPETTTPPSDTPPVATKPKPLKPSTEEILPKKPQPNTPPVATKPKPLKPSTEEILPEKPQPNTPPVATKLPDPSPSTNETESSSAPVSPSASPPEQQTPVGSGSASLLGGTYRKSVGEDGGSSFLQPEANASQQALNSSGIDARQDLDMGPYFAEIRRRVRRNWQPSFADRNRHTVLAFSIQRNGQITGLRVSQSSGSSKVDRESLEAVQKAGPFAALPANYPNEQLDIVFSFNLYLHQGVFTPQLENWQRF